MACGVEFSQLALIVEALAQTATHNKTPGVFLTKAEKLAFSNGKPTDTSLASIVQTEYETSEFELRNPGPCPTSLETEQSRRLKGRCWSMLLSGMWVPVN